MNVAFYGAQIALAGEVALTALLVLSVAVSLVLAWSIVSQWIMQVIATRFSERVLVRVHVGRGLDFGANCRLPAGLLSCTPSRAPPLFPGRGSSRWKRPRQSPLE